VPGHHLRHRRPVSPPRQQIRIGNHRGPRYQGIPPKGKIGAASLGLHGGARHKQGSTTTLGRGADYEMARLKRDDSALAEKVMREDRGDIGANPPANKFRSGGRPSRPGHQPQPIPQNRWSGGGGEPPRANRRPRPQASGNPPSILTSAFAEGAGEGPQRAAGEPRPQASGKSTRPAHIHSHQGKRNGQRFGRAQQTFTRVFPLRLAGVG
jgi:hypothetical protein